MTFKEYSELASRTIRTDLSHGDQLVNAAMGASGEAGEILDAVKKFRFQDHDVSRDKLLEEAGDCLWYLNCLAVTIGSSLEEVAAMNNRKLELRYAGSFSPEKSIKRVDV